MSWQDARKREKGVSWSVGAHKPVLGLFPARMREISRPRLKAWLKRRRVWKVDTKGNQEPMATGMKMNMPIPASYSRARVRIDFHSRSFFTTGFHATAICRRRRATSRRLKRG